jgi:hypothetical protein
MKHLRQIVFLVMVPFMALPTFASAWNRPSHMLSAAIAYIHQPLRTAQLFTADYPKGNRGGNEIWEVG